MENITTKFKTRFLQDENPEADASRYPDSKAKLTTGYKGAGIKIARNIARFVFKTKRRSIVFGLLLISIIVFGGYHFFNKPTPEEKAKAELAVAVAAVSKVMVLPEGDQPVLATVTDAEALTKQQAFFAGAVNGDQLLLFPKSMKAVIWSPSRGKIINVGPIQQSVVATENSQTPSTPASTGSAAVSQNKIVLTVEIRNGTGKNGLASQIGEQIGGNAGYKVLQITDAHKKDYPQTVVVNKTNDVEKLQLANSLVAALNARMSSELPSGEKDTDADILVILGGK